MSTSEALQTVATAVGLIAALVAAGFVLVRGRQIARLERMLGAARASVQPLPESRQRNLTGTRAAPGRYRRRMARTAVVVVGVGALIVVGVRVWSAIGLTTGRPARAGGVASSGLGVDPGTLIPAQLPALGSPATYRVAVLNAANPNAPLATEAAASLSAAGYSVGTVGNTPTGGLARSVVMWTPGEQLLAEHVARSLGITVVAPLDGLTTQDIGGAQAAVLIGLDRLRS